MTASVLKQFIKIVFGIFTNYIITDSDNENIKQALYNIPLTYGIPHLMCSITSDEIITEHSPGN
jgi:hypothetical protein